MLFLVQVYFAGCMISATLCFLSFVFADPIEIEQTRKEYGTFWPAMVAVTISWPLVLAYLISALFTKIRHGGI